MRRPSLRTARDFRRVYDAGRRARSDGITVFVAPAAPDEERLGIVVPGRVGSAVVRNRLKRRIRAILAATPPDGGRDVVVQAGPAAASLGFQDLEKHLGAALSRAGGAE